MHKANFGTGDRTQNMHTERLGGDTGQRLYIQKIGGEDTGHWSYIENMGDRIQDTDHPHRTQEDGTQDTDLGTEHPGTGHRTQAME